VFAELGGGGDRQFAAIRARTAVSHNLSDLATVRSYARLHFALILLEHDVKIVDFR